MYVCAFVCVHLTGGVRGTRVIYRGKTVYTTCTLVITPNANLQRSRCGGPPNEEHTNTNKKIYCCTII